MLLQDIHECRIPAGTSIFLFSYCSLAILELDEQSYYEGEMKIFSDLSNLGCLGCRKKVKTVCENCLCTKFGENSTQPHL